MIGMGAMVERRRPVGRRQFADSVRNMLELDPRSPRWQSQQGVVATSGRRMDQAARWYSWMSPPRTSLRSMRTDGSPGTVGRGVASPIPRWGRATL